MVDDHGVRGKTVLTGMLPGRERLAALVDAHVLCQPSFHENFGLVVVEALACGTPVVVSDQVYLHPRVSEAGVGGVCRLLVRDVVHELRRWVDDGEMRERAAAKARAFALQNFDWDQIGRLWSGHYHALRPTRVVTT
jgi:glycosyltransferase involved in cell wall biosynthesis